MPLLNLATVRDSFLKNPPEKRRAELLSEFLSVLEAAVGEHEVWLLRSLHDIVLLARDDWESHWFVRIRVSGQLEDRAAYQIDYQLPAADAPWPHATVIGSASSKERAAEMVAIAIERSRGWSREVREQQQHLASLRNSLRALAQDSGFQTQLLRTWGEPSAELPERLSQARAHLRACAYPFTPTQGVALAQLFARFETMSGPQNADQWTSTALTSSPQWNEIRELATSALAAFDWGLAAPPTEIAAYGEDFFEP